ncbi:MAG: flagellar motor protein MotB [Lachnospiraceae bacterium]|nr:flagellar motor protein MotB [Lachnospiraceae bacterium]
MAKKKQEEAPSGSPAWMATFSDLMNLLLCFFVLLFSMSTIEEEKFEMVISSLTAALSVLESSSGTTMAEGTLISIGVTQLPDYANFFGDSMSQGKFKEGDNSDTHSIQTKDDMSEDAGGDSGEESEDGQTDSQGTEGQQDQQSQAESDQSQGATEEDQTGGQTEKDQTGADQDEDTESGGKDQEESSSDVSTEEAAAKVEEAALEESEQMAKEMEEQMKRYGIQDLVDIDFNGQYVRYSLNGALLFDSGQATVKEKARPLIKKLGKILNAYQDHLIEVEGHTDNVPIRNSHFESNMVLSMYRALSVSEDIVKNSSLDPANVYSSGRGEYNPVASNDTPEGRARNRRVEIKIYNSFNSQEVEG